VDTDPEVSHATARINGVKLHYVTADEGDPLVLLHGWPQTWYEWRHVLPALAAEYTVVAPDLRGMGDSATPRDGYDSETVATDVRELVDRLGYDAVAVVEHDWDMPAAYAYAAQYRDEVRVLAVLEAGLPGIREDEKPGAPWHIPFHQVCDLPELLVRGNERA
jgi:pimeloyl-ACP methyl ester carboxylesterase